MSAGICIMNKHAIALAADSAVTIGQHLAIHNSANKLFALSKVAPVGAIIYSNAELMGVPAEIIIKQYKEKHGNQNFPTLAHFVADFFSFLLSNKALFHFAHNEKKLVGNIYQDLLAGLNGDYQRMIQNKISAVQRELTEDELTEIQQNAVSATCDFVNSLPLIPNFDVTTYIKARYTSDIIAYIKNTFPWVSDDQTNTLCEAVCSVYNKQFFRNGYIGIAFAGYGENDIFPCMFHIHMSGIINDKMRYVKKEQVEITESTPSSISPLAQTDVMQTFLFGINDSFINDIAKEIPVQIQNSFNGIDDSLFAPGKKSEVQNSLNATTSSVLNQIIQKARQQYLFPITNSIATLPIEELSLLAESMINITSLRRKVAIDNNIGTVGGPVDLAIISKGEGFIWLKRKHYFDPNLNPQYMYSHYLPIRGQQN